MMAATVVLAIDTAMLRAFLNGYRFFSIILMFFTLQVALCFLLRTRGAARRFWIGFMALGTVTIIIVYQVLLDLSSPWSNQLTDFAMSNRLMKFAMIPVGFLLDHFGLASGPDPFGYRDVWCYASVGFFLIELPIALLGGLVGLCFVRRGHGISAAIPPSL